MNRSPRALAAAELLLLLPSAIFIAALLMRYAGGGLEQSAQQIVMWYAGKQWTLWVLLIALPLIVLVTGGAALLGSWNDGKNLRGTDPATLALAALTLLAAAILAVVGMHVLMN